MKAIILSLILLTLLTSCYDNHEPNDLAYATAIGIDKGTDKNYNITIQFAKPHNISGGEQGGSGKDIIGNITVEAPNIYSAIGLGNHIISKTLDMSHLQLFLFSRETAETGIHNFIETISRSKEIRPNVYTAVCDGEAGEFLKKASPVVDINPAKYYQLIFGKSDFRAIPQSYSQDLYFYMNTPERNSVIPLAGIPETQEGQSGGSSGGGGNEESSKQDENSQTTSPNPLHTQTPVNTGIYEFGVRDYKAGEVEVYSDVKGEVTGGAVFKGDKMIGTLGIAETQIYNYLTGNDSKNYISFKTDKSQTPITVLVGLDSLPSISYNKKKHKTHIKLALTADFVALPDDYAAENDLEYFEALAAGAVKKQAETLILRTQREFDSDILGFGEHAKRKFLTLEEFNLFHWESQYRHMSFEVEIDLDIRRTGLTLRNNM